MPKLTPKTERIRHKRFLKALDETGSPAEAALKTQKIGSRGGKDLMASAAAAGTQMLNRIKPEEMEEHLPMGLLMKRHTELLNKREVATAFDHESGERIKVVVDQPDTQAVSKALDMAYKIKGTYAPEKSININANINPQDPKALALAEEYEKKLKEQF